MKRILPLVRYYFRKAKRKLQPQIEWFGRLSTTIRIYFREHPKVRIATLIAALPLSILLILLIVVFSNTPDVKSLQAIRNPIASEIYTADSVLIGRYFIQDRTYVRYDDISPLVIDALISTEDVRFYQHHGVDFVSLGRVLVKSILLQDESAGGGSTITQQLAKNLYPRKDFWMFSMLVNKLREAVIAKRIEKLYSKKEIITLYLNTIPFADNTYGIQAAAKRFFSTNARDLTLDQAAVLIGMLKATHYYNPRLFPRKSLARRNVVLAQMRKYKFIDQAQKDSIQSLPLKLEYSQVARVTEVAPYFREYLRQEVERWCQQNSKRDGTPYDLFTDGLKIYTTIDSKLQQYAENAVAKQMSELQKAFNEHWGDEKPWKDYENLVDEAIIRSPRYKNLKEHGLSHNDIIEEMSKPVPIRLFSWEGEKDAEVSPIDSIKHHLAFLNAGFLAMEPATGKVKAWVGGINHEFFQYDHVKLTTKRQVGSIFKPIVFAAAIDQGIAPCELISAGQETYIDDEGVEWKPKNTQYDYQVEYSMRGALAYSVNTVSVKLIQRAGIGNTISLARKMGVQSEMPDVPSIALGSSAISLMEMTAAYACLANEGVSSFPYFITSIQDREGNVFTNFQHEISGEQVLKRETALKVRHMLQTVVQEGTASRLRWKYGIYNDVAGKTGTTQANADGWFMAMTPKLVIGTWVGADDPRIRFRSTQLGQGANSALPMVAYFLKEVNRDKTYKEISTARFPALPYAVRRELGCDLYEISDNLWMELEKKVNERDSLIRVDSMATPPPETFLQTLYKRKRKIMFASQEEDAGHARNTSLMESINR